MSGSVKYIVPDKYGTRCKNGLEKINACIPIVVIILFIMLALFFLWLFVFILLLHFILLFNYWQNLFRAKEKYSRDELVALPKILLQEFRRLFFSSSSFIFIMLNFFTGITLASFLVFLGGALALDISPAPDLAGNQLSNYFFQSFLFLLVLHLLEPKWKEIFLGEDKQNSLLAKIFHGSAYLYLGLAISLAAWNISIWLLYNEIHSFYYIMNVPLCLLYANYRLQLEEKSARGMNAIANEDKPDLTNTSDLSDANNLADIDDLELPAPNFSEPPKER